MTAAIAHVYTGHDPSLGDEGTDLLLKCGHPKSADNYPRKPNGRAYCKACNRARCERRRDRLAAAEGRERKPFGWGIGADGRRRNEERFWSKVNMGDPVFCWRWMGAVDERGYGLYNKESRAHRVAYRIMVGEIPAGLELDHLCNEPGCVNPWHLEPVTRAENSRRRSRRQTRCKQGHEFTPENTFHSQSQRRCKACMRARDEKRQGFPRGSRKPRGHREITWEEYQALAPIVEAVPGGGWVTVRIRGSRFCAWCPPSVAKPPISLCGDEHEPGGYDAPHVGEVPC